MNEEALKRRWLKEDEAAINSAVNALFQHRETRRLIWWLLQIGRVGGQPFSNNALQTAFACGELNIGNQILERVTSVSPEGYVELMKEMADERRSRDTELTAARDAARAGAFDD